MYDQPYNQPYNQYGQPCGNKHSEKFELASLTLGLVAVMSCTCLYLAIPCGALAIILANLSRGGQMRYGQRAQVGLILGIIALAMIAVICGVSFAVALHEYGSLEGILDAGSEMTGLDYNELLQELYQTN